MNMSILLNGLFGGKKKNPKDQNILFQPIQIEMF